MVSRDFRLGDWIVRPQRDCIESGDEIIHLKPKVMAVLECLAAAKGEVVSRNKLFETVWPGGVVSDATLTQCVVELRHAFGDSARDPCVIETIPKVGFRLIPPVLAIEQESPVQANGVALTTTGRIPARARSRHTILLAAFAALIAVITVAYLASHRQVSPGENHLEMKTIAVLPFRDLSEDQDQGWFADGLSEEMINRLGQLDRLRVTESASSSYFQYKNVEVKAIAEDLGVDNILEGSVSRDGGKLRVTAKLLEAQNGTQLWSKIFDRDIKDVFEVQKEIAESVATALSIRLEVGKLGTMPGSTSNVEAFERSSRAMSLLREFTTESMLEGIALLKQAVELDPEYANAWLWLAQFYKMASMCVDDRVDLDWLQLAAGALDQARSIDPELPALLGMEVNQFTLDGQWPEVERLMKNAPPMATSMDADLLFFYGIFLVHVGRIDEAVSMLERYRLLNPMAAHGARMLAYAYLAAGRGIDALDQYEQAWALDNVIRSLGSSEGLTAALAVGDREVIRKWLERAIKFADHRQLEFFETMNEKFDDPKAALDRLREIYQQPEPDSPGRLIATWAAYFGGTDLAIDALTRSPNSWELWTPLMHDVRQRPEFRQIVQKLGLVDYWRAYTWADVCHPVGEEGFECV